MEDDKCRCGSEDSRAVTSPVSVETTSVARQRVTAAQPPPTVTASRRSGRIFSYLHTLSRSGRIFSYLHAQSLHTYDHSSLLFPSVTAQVDKLCLLKNWQWILIILERVDEGHAKGLLNVGSDEIRCSLWRLSAEWHDYKLIQSYYRKEHKCRLKIYYLSVLNEQDKFLVISEEVIKTLDEEIETMKKLDSGETKLDDKDGFLYPLRSLFDSLTAVREICHDFKVKSSDLFFVKSEKIKQSEKMYTKSEILIIKVGFVQPYELKENEKLQCTKNVSRMVFNKWIGIKNAELPKDVLLLRKVLDSFEPNK
nr:hypothetical protein Iba_chr09aCG5540 [Ipomoea batatas]